MEAKCRKAVCQVGKLNALFPTLKKKQSQHITHKLILFQNTVRASGAAPIVPSLNLHY